MTTTTHTNHSNHTDKGILNPLATQALDTAKEIGTRAVSAAEENFEKAQVMTEKAVRKYPIAAVGVAIGAGIALGAVGYRMMNPPKPTFGKRLGELAIAGTAINLFRKFF